MAEAEIEADQILERRSSHSELTLPISRVRTIMKSSPDVENISQDALYAVTAATELFIKELTRKVYMSKTGSLSEVNYKDLAEFVNSEEQYKGFLDEIVPLKVLGSVILAERNADQAKSVDSAAESEDMDAEEEEEEPEGETNGVAADEEEEEES